MPRKIDDSLARRGAVRGMNRAFFVAAIGGSLAVSACSSNSGGSPGSGQGGSGGSAGKETGGAGGASMPTGGTAGTGGSGVQISEGDVCVDGHLVFTDFTPPAPEYTICLPSESCGISCVTTGACPIGCADAGLDAATPNRDAAAVNRDAGTTLDAGDAARR
jgi:hypothetical protein